MEFAAQKGNVVGPGKAIRWNRLFAHPSGRLCSVAIDHFMNYQTSLPAGLRDLPGVIEAIVAGRPDALTMHKGAAMSCWPKFAGRVPLIIQSIIARPDDSADEAIATPEDAVRLGADAFATCAFVRGPSEAAHLRRVADFVRQAAPFDMPVILHVYPRRYGENGPEVVYDPENIAWAVRCGVECGVDLIKVPYTGDPTSYGQIVRECPLPIVAAGGPRAETLRDALAMASGVIAAGARGLTVGRNIWGFSQVTQAVRAFNCVIHENVAPDQAMQTAQVV